MTSSGLVEADCATKWNIKPNRKWDLFVSEINSFPNLCARAWRAILIALSKYAQSCVARPDTATIWRWIQLHRALNSRIAPKGIVSLAHNLKHRVRVWFAMENTATKVL